MKTQYDRLAVLLTRPGGCTSVDVMLKLPSTCPHKRLSYMRREMGWKIQKTQIGKLIRYTGQPPVKKSDYVPKTVWQPRNIVQEMGKWKE
jgi:hypothetical protein